jgi:hypothetical protein
VIVESVTPRNFIRTADNGSISDGPTWIDLLDDRHNAPLRWDTELLESILPDIRDNYPDILDTLHRWLSMELPE